MSELNWDALTSAMLLWAGEINKTAQAMRAFTAAYASIVDAYIARLTVPGIWAYRCLLWLGYGHLDAIGFLEETFPLAFQPW